MTLPEVNFLVPKNCRCGQKISICKKFVGLQIWATWQALDLPLGRASSNKGSKTQKVCPQKFLVCTKIGEFTTKKLAFDKLRDLPTPATREPPSQLLTHFFRGDTELGRGSRCGR